jgi:hypothetical protein
VANGEATKTSRRAKKLAIAARIGTVHGRTVRISRRFRTTAAEPMPVSTSSQRSSEPSWPLQKEERV